jgi:phosphonate transport system permease protein
VWDAVGMLLIVVVVVTMILDQISSILRQRIITGRWAWVGYGRRRRALNKGL